MTWQEKEAAAQAVRDLQSGGTNETPEPVTRSGSGASAALTRREQHRQLDR
jgi:hypothetical protein